ncbi:hypothetical protein Y032_0306g1977 [Ancylostoma ceylanicum]|uniref:BPTI/Kunitz inhibitor domain-containing protein n=1 Tax=Ancylostoma ceylanicum TaxID=53326 RepID=A0A016S3Z4_9BILA|nr:hypothetical protein Y032_0306g1977 [Ancylostoma ceylanicum]
MHVQIIGTLTMLGIAVTATLCFLVPLCGSFPMCTDGQPPLMEANDAFPCARGCPRGFFCEMQDSLHTASLGICCANRTELQLLYGSDNKDHADPIWNGDPVPSAQTSPKPSSLAATEVTTSTEPSRSVRVIATATESRAPDVVLIEDTDARLNVTVRSRGNGLLPIVISDSDVIPEDSGPSNGLLSSRGAATDPDEAGGFDNSIAKDVREVTTHPADPQDQFVQANESARETTAPPPQNVLELLQTADSGNLTDTAGDFTVSEENVTLVNITALPETVENPDSTTFNSTEPSFSAELANSTGNSTEVFTDLASPGKEPEELPKAEEKGAKEEKQQENAAPTEKSRSAQDALAVIPRKEEELPKENSGDRNLDLVSITVGSKDVKAPTDIGQKSLDEQNSVKIADIGEDARVEEEKQFRYSCERQAYKFSCHSGSVLTQPTIRWYLNEQGECEYYPWGYCPGDRVVESTTIRTKLECVRECLRNSTNVAGNLVEAVGKTSETPGEAIAKFSSNTASIKEQFKDGAEKEGQLLAPENTQEGKGAAGDSPDANVTAVPVTSSPLETAIAGGIATSAPAETSTRSDAKEKKDFKGDGAGLGDPKAIEEKGVGDAATTLTADNSTEKKSDEESLWTPPLEAVGLQPAHHEGTQDSAGKSSKEGNSLDNQVNDAAESSSSPSSTKKNVKAAENRELRSNLPDGETTEGITYETTMKPKEKVLCTPSPYRYICKRGMPSQFVYRWSKADSGKCQSFPYGYCLTEWNHPHPRTREECEHYCN